MSTANTATTTTATGCTSSSPDDDNESKMEQQSLDTSGTTAPTTTTTCGSADGVCGVSVGVDQVVGHLQKDLGLNFVALDFDQTILSIHTGGYWQGTAQELVDNNHIRPEMLELIPRLVAFEAMNIAVVTFSSQPKMIRQVVDGIILKKQQIAPAVLPVRGEDRSWDLPNPIHRSERWWEEDDNGLLDLEEVEGKQPHMLSAIQEIEEKFAAAGGDGNKKLQITKATTLLIDDDKDNIRIAKENGIRAVWLDPDHPERLFRDLYELS